MLPLTKCKENMHSPDTVSLVGRTHPCKHGATEIQKRCNKLRVVFFSSDNRQGRATCTNILWSTGIYTVDLLYARWSLSRIFASLRLD